MRERHCRRPRLTPEELHRSGTLSRSGTPRWRTREEKRPNRLTIPRDALLDLLSELIEADMGRLVDHLERAAREQADPARRLDAVALAYVAFGLDNPHAY